jgi:hypothetical protein
MYLKITNAEENHYGLQYHDGLNVDPVPFDKEGSCCPGGIYFTTPEYICNFLQMGCYIREVMVPEDAEMVKDPGGNKWRSPKVMLGPRKELWNVDTWKWLLEIIIDTGINEVSSKSLDTALRWSSYDGYLEVVKYLVENGADIHANNGYALKYASQHGYLEVVKFLVENGADIHVGNDCALRCASFGRLDIVKYLVEHGADIHADNDYALKYASQHGYLEVVKFLVENGADIHVGNDYAFRYAFANKHLEVVEYLEGYKRNLL